MSNTNNKSKNLVDFVIENQSNVVDQIMESTKKITKDLPFVNETLDKGHILYKKSIEQTSDLLEKTSQKFTESTNEMKEKAENSKNYFEQWFENQTNWSKNIFINPFNNTDSNPLNNWQSFVNQANTNMMNGWGSSPFNQMMNQYNFQNYNSKVSEGMNQWSTYVRQYLDLMNPANTDWWNKFSNLTAAESFSGMNDMSQKLNKFYELWIPVLKNIQDKNFNLETFKSSFNLEKYKEFIDNFFQFMPDNSKKMADQFNQNFIQSMKQMSETGLNQYKNYQNQFQNNPLAQTNPFSSMTEMYMNWNKSMNEAISPLSRLVEENGSVKNAKVWSEISDNMVQFNLKNNELQYMIYQHGLKVMETVAEKTLVKLNNGESIDSIIKIFQEWLMSGDEIYGKLFQTDEYSKLMTEVNSLQLKVKQEMDKQMEKLFFANLPVATRTEMDEVYKNIYDLKKWFRQMEKNMNPVEEPKNTKKK